MTAVACKIEIHRFEINLMLAHSKPFSNNNGEVLSAICFIEPPYRMVTKKILSLKDSWVWHFLFVFNLQIFIKLYMYSCDNQTAYFHCRLNFVLNKTYEGFFVCDVGRTFQRKGKV